MRARAANDRRQTQVPNYQFLSWSNPTNNFLAIWSDFSIINLQEKRIFKDKVHTDKLPVLHRFTIVKNQVTNRGGHNVHLERAFLFSKIQFLEDSKLDTATNYKSQNTNFEKKKYDLAAILEANEPILWGKFGRYTQHKLMTNCCFRNCTLITFAVQQKKPYDLQSYLSGCRKFP